MLGSMLEARSSSISGTAVWNAAGFLGSLAHRRGRRLAETPVQKAIGIVRELMRETPEQREKCEQLMSLLTSRELLQPAFLSDNTLAQQDPQMRDWLGGTGMVEERRDVRTAAAWKVRASMTSQAFSGVSLALWLFSRK